MSDDAANSISPDAPVPSPKWWCRAHSYVFIALILFHIVSPGLMIAAIVSASRPPGDWVMFLFMGVGVGQLFLLGIWTALGGLRMVVRICLAPAITVLVVSSFVLAISLVRPGGPLWKDIWPIIFACMVFGTTAVWMLHSALLPLRWLLGWRVDFDPAYHRSASHGNLQMGIKHFFGWTIISAIPFALARTITLAADNANKSQLHMAVVIYCSVGVAIALVVGGPLALACLARSRAWLKILAALAWATVLALCVARITIQFQSPGFGPPEHLVYLMCALPVGAFTSTILGNLLFLRLFGLQLFSVKPRPRSRPASDL